jgi:polyisoprenoid-binding protein YceI
VYSFGIAPDENTGMERNPLKIRIKIHPSSTPPQSWYNMQKNLFLLGLLALLTAAVPASAQENYFTRKATVKFDATAPNSSEAIKAVSYSNSCIFDKSNGKVEMAVLMKGLVFEKALMQEHFNYNYVESDKYPKAHFKGKVDNIAAVDFSKDGTYNTTATGQMTMHGVTQNLSVPVTFTVKNGVVSANLRFSLTIADYKIDIPDIVSDRVARQAVIEVSAILEKLG